VLSLYNYMRFLYHYRKIPRGDYCYRITKIEYPDDKFSPPIIWSENCPFYFNEEDGTSKCLLTGTSGDILLDQQIKCCGLKNREDEE